MRNIVEITVNYCIVGPSICNGQKNNECYNQAKCKQTDNWTNHETSFPVLARHLPQRIASLKP